MISLLTFSNIYLDTVFLASPTLAIRESEVD